MVNYFIFVFNEKYYEDDTFLGRLFKFPEPDKGGFKIKGKNKGSWGSIIYKVGINDKVLWIISAKSMRSDKKTFWGYGTVIEIDNENNLWKLKSKEFKKKIKIDDIINYMPLDYKRLYEHSHIKIGDFISTGFFGTNQIDKFQYNFILNFCKNYFSD